MNDEEPTLESVTELLRANAVHTVEVGVADTYGHIRGKRVPVDRFLNVVARGGVNIADAIYVFDIQCEIVDSPFINMGTGYLDMHLEPDLSTLRLLPHRPGYALVLAAAVNEHGDPHPLDPRNVLAQQVRRLEALGYAADVATELECYMFNADWTPFQSHVQYSSLTDALGLEAIVSDMRAALMGAGVPIESSNPEYGPGQLEINFSPADPLTTADNTVIFKSIVKQVARQHGANASFMPKPYLDQSGSGMHIHSSLKQADRNLFGEAGAGVPNPLMAQWTAGLLANAQAMQLVGIPTPNGFRRVVANTFCPTHVHWGEDNRTVMARLTMTSGSANRVEYRSFGADANPYLAIAAVLAAGCDGIERSLTLPPMAHGDMYSDPGDSPELPTALPVALNEFGGSALAAALGTEFSANFLALCENELAVTRQHNIDHPDEVHEWEFRRYREHA